MNPTVTHEVVAAVSQIAECRPTHTRRSRRQIATRLGVRFGAAEEFVGAGKIFFWSGCTQSN